MSSRAPRVFPHGYLNLDTGQVSGSRNHRRQEDGRLALHIVVQGKESIAASYIEEGPSAAVSQMKEAATPHT